MTRLPIASDMMSSVGYDALAAVLEVEFRNGSVYEYKAVPREEYEALLRATSKGQFFNARLRKAFAFTRIC